MSHSENVKNPNKPLTDLAVKNAKPRPTLWRILDGDKTYRGLRLEIYPDGAKRWAFRFKFEGSDCTEGLGVYPFVSLAEARAACFKSKMLLKQGISPTEQKRRDKELRQFEKGNTFEIVAEKWMQWRKRKKNLDERYVKKIWQSLERHAFPKLGKRPINEIRAIECVSLLERMQENEIGDQTGRVLRRIKNIFDYAVVHQLIENNPVTSIKADDLIKPKTKHFDSLPFEAIPQFLQDVDANPDVYITSKLAIRLQILTGVRTTELRGAMWKEIDFETCLWTIPSERPEVYKTGGGGMKMKVDHIVPLSRQSIAIIEQLKRYTGSSEFLFPSRSSMRKCISDSTLSKLMRSVGYDGSVEGKPRAVPHGFRTTMRMKATKSKLFIKRAIEFQLAHKNPNAVEAAYERPEEFLDERIEMVQWYADEIEKIVVSLTKL